MFYNYISLFSSLLIALFLLFHDWIDMYPFNDLETFNRHCSLRNKILMTIINSSFFILYTAILILYWNSPIPFFAKLYIVICNLLFLSGIIFSWWLSYFFGWPISQVKELNEMYGKTHAFLPRIGNNPTPNTLHVIFHIVFIVNFIFSTLLILSC